MKKIFYLVAIIAAIAFVSCTNLDDDASKIENTSAADKDRVDPRNGG